VSESPKCDVACGRKIFLFQGPGKSRQCLVSRFVIDHMPPQAPTGKRGRVESEEIEAFFQHFRDSTRKRTLLMYVLEHATMNKHIENLDRLSLGRCEEIESAEA
jgi:hypothetical protein